MLPISICTIVKNEEKHLLNYLSAIKKCLKGYPHEVIIVDTGSTDSSVDIIRQYMNDNPAEKVSLEHFKWCDDFSAAKNFAIGLSQNDWVLVLDADEYLKSFDTKCPELMQRSHSHSVGMIDIINHTGRGMTYDKVVRFFNKKFFHYTGMIHEQVTLINTCIDTAAVEHISMPVAIDHYGYAGTPEEKKAKVGRNNALIFKMLDEDPNDPYLYFQLGQSYASIGDGENAYKYYGKGLEFDVDERLQYVKQMVIGYGNAMLDTGRFAEALSFEGIYDSFKSSADFLFLMGMIYLRNGLINEAYREFENATKASECEVDGSNTYLPFYNMALIKEAMQDIPEAVRLYKKCGDFAPAKERLAELN